MTIMPCIRGYIDGKKFKLLLQQLFGGDDDFALCIWGSLIAPANAFAHSVI